MTQKQTKTALNHNKEIVFAADLTKKDRGQYYYCVECHQRKYYTHGDIMMPHFRDYTGSTCNCTPESNLHKAIKGLIIDHFGDTAEEEYSSTNITDKINRRADVFLHTEKPVVFEIQVSSISQEEVRQRTRDWQSVGCEIIWIPIITNSSHIFSFGSWLKFNDNNINQFTEDLNNYQNFYMEFIEDVVEEIKEVEGVEDFNNLINIDFNSFNLDTRSEVEERLLNNLRFKQMAFKLNTVPRDLLIRMKDNQSVMINNHFDKM